MPRARRSASDRMGSFNEGVAKAKNRATHTGLEIPEADTHRLPDKGRKGANTLGKRQPRKRDHESGSTTRG